MSFTIQRMCAWSGIVCNLMFFGGFWLLARLFPPIPPSWTAHQVAVYYQEHSIGIRLGAIMLVLGVSLLIPFSAVISVQLKRIEGRFSPMAYTQMLAGSLGVIPVMFAPVLWSVAAFRTDWPDVIVLLLDDISWVLLIYTVSPPMIQFVAIGLAILGDRNPDPVFPRWLAYLCFWCAVLSVPGLAVVFFHSGPFAWNGIFGFWLVALAFSAVWTNAMTLMLLKAIKQQERLAGLDPA